MQVNRWPGPGIRSVPPGREEDPKPHTKRRCAGQRILISLLDRPTMSFKNNLTLPNGAPVPQIGLGTWLSKPKEVENAVGPRCD